MSVENFVVKIFLCFMLANQTLSQFEELKPRIVGGFNVTSWNGFKHQVSIRTIPSDKVRFGNGHRCGGSLINQNTVLSAAHCVHDGKKKYLKASNFVVAMGGLDRWIRDNNTVYINVNKIVGHKNFDPDTFNHDIALLILAREVPYNHPTAQPISRSRKSASTGQLCQISGWGTTAYEGGTQPNRLKAVNLIINSKADCNKKESYGGKVLNGMFCAGPFSGPDLVDSCQGDSGGPLTCDGVLVGITSNGIGCAIPNYPGIYIDVFQYQKWIETNKSSSFMNNFLTTLGFLVVLYCVRHL
jgi:trypsin